MEGKCLRTCVDDRSIRYDRNYKYDIDPENPCAIYFELPKDGRLIAIETEKKRRLKTQETQKRLKQPKPKWDPNEFDAEIEKLKAELQEK